MGINGVHAHLIEQIRADSKHFYEQLDPIPPDLWRWADASGLSKGRAELRRVLAQQAALASLLVGVLQTLRQNNEQAEYLEALALDDLPFNKLLSRSASISLSSELETLVSELRSAFPEDVLGWLYEKLTPQAEHRTLGQHWTPSPIS